jgi:hypothetical protein
MQPEKNHVHESPQRAPLSDETIGQSRLWRFPWVTFIILGIPFGWPLVNEGTLSPCGAAESYVFARTAAVTSNGNPLAGAMLEEIVGVSNGAMARGIAKQQLPNVPTPISCTWVYWYATFNPSAFEKIGAKATPQY